MMLSTRIAVMEAGRLRQVDTPKRMYEYPQSRFVAEFIGNINIFEGRVTRAGQGRVAVECPDAGTVLHADTSQSVAPGRKASIAIRPEKIFIDKEPPGGRDQTSLRGVVWDFGYFGNLSLYQVKLASGKVVLVSAQNRRRSADRPIDWDDEVYLSWDGTSTLLLED